MSGYDAERRSAAMMGNVNALKDGSRSPRVVAARSRATARRLQRELRQGKRQYRFRQAERLEAQAELVFERLQQQSGRGGATLDAHLRYESLLVAAYDRMERALADKQDDLSVLLGGAS